MQLWKWDLTLSNRQARVAKCMQLLNIQVELAEDVNEDKEQRERSWASATRELRRLRHPVDRSGWREQRPVGSWGVAYG
jgi:hypothetical protein